MAQVLAPRLRTPRMVGVDPHAEEASAITVVGLALGFVGQGLLRHIETWWALLPSVASIVVIAVGLVRAIRTRGASR